MKIFKPKFWIYKYHLLTILLIPISLIFSLFVFLKKKLTKTLKFSIPVLCVGNIYIGGTGKTPLALFICKKLREKGKNPAIIKKYYPNHKDEFEFLRYHFKNIIIKDNRVEAINEAKREGYDCAVLDDGFQDYKINKDFKILCFNSKQLIGNGFVLPAGPLRENLSAVKDVHAIVINGDYNYEFEKKISKINNNLKIYYSNYKIKNCEKFLNKEFLAFAGIGNPSNFFDLLEANNVKVKKKISYPDHYEFSDTEIKNIINDAKKNNLDVITTEKDYFRIKKYNFEEIGFVELNLEFNSNEKILENILKKI